MDKRLEGELHKVVALDEPVLYEIVYIYTQEGYVVDRVGNQRD